MQPVASSWSSESIVRAARRFFVQRGAMRPSRFRIGVAELLAGHTKGGEKGVAVEREGERTKTGARLWSPLFEYLFQGRSPRR